MANMRLILVVGIVVSIIAYIAVITMNHGLRMDAFADLGEKTNIFTMYYMNGCPHCESILPDFKKLVAAGQVTLNGKKTQFRMLEQADPAAAPELEARNVKGFPTFYLATADKNFIEYQGDRSASAIKEFIGQNAV
jgi:hypothetical protein